MKMIVISPGCLLLSSSAAACVYGDRNCQHDPKLSVQVKTPSGMVMVKGPRISVDGAYADYEPRWSVRSLLQSPNRRFTAIHYDGAAAKFWNAEVYLVHPDRRVIKLPESGIFKVQWSPDSKYIIGQGSNTLRLWNLNGKVRMEPLGQIRAVSVKGQRVCVNLQWNGWMQELWLAIPSLQRIADRDAGGQTTCQPPTL